MMLQLKVVWHLFILCAIGFALIVRGSTGFSIFPSKEAASTFSHVEEQKLDYIPSAAPFLNGSTFLPPLTSHPFESSPPGPKNIQQSPSHLPSTAIVSPTQSAVAPQPPSSAPPSLGAPSHDLAPQQPIHVYATPPVAIPDIPTLQSPVVQPHNLTPSLPVFAPYASASPQASIPKHAYSPASTAVPSHVSSLPPVAISPHTSVPRPPVTPSHVSFLPPLAISPHTSVPRPPVTLSHISSLPPLAVTPHTSVPHTPVTPSHVSSLPPLAISPHTSVPQPPVMPSHVFASPPLVSRPSLSTPPPSTTFHDSTRPPPAISPSISSKSPRPSEYALPPSHTVGRTPSALSPQASSTTPTHATTIHHRTSPSPVAYPRSASSPPSVPLKATFPSTPVAPLGNLAPLPSIPTLPARPPSAPTTFHTSTPLPPVRSEGLAPYSPPIVPLLPLPVVLPSHLPTPSPSVAPHDPTPLLAPPTIPDSSAPPPVAVNPHHFGSSPTISPYATPKSRVPSHSSAPPPQLMPSDVTAPPHPSATPPITMPSHVMAPPPFDNPRVLASPPTYTPKVSAPPPNPNIPEHSSAQSPLSAPTHASSSPPTALSPPPASHDLGPPPTHAPYISAPPPGATVSDHSSASPPTPPIDASSPPPHVVPPIVSPPSPPDAAPSHDLAPSPPAESHFSVPPPSSTPPISSPTSKNASYPPSASVPPHASAPSTAAESPLIASSPSVHTVPSGSLPPVSSPVASNSSAPLVVPPVRSPSINPVIPREPPSISPEAQLPHVSSPAPSIDQRGVPVPVAPSGQTHPLSPAAQHPLSPATQHPQGFAPYIAPSVHKSRGLPSLAPVASVTPPISPTVKEAHSPSFSPLPSISKGRHQTSYNVPSPAPNQQGQHESPAPESTPKYHPPTIHNPGTSPAMAPSQSPSTEDYISPASVSALPFPSGPSMTPFLSPEISPSGSSTKKPELAPPILALPPPPPNDNCLSYTCLEPYTNTIPGSPCGCVLPMKVELRIGVALYNFFPLVPEMAREIATGIFMKQSQVRIMGANAATEQPDKTLLLIDLVPLGDKLDNITAFLIYERFWNKQVAISKSLFGDYDVLNVQYPGLPPSPPMAPSDIADMNGGPYPGGQGSKIHPLGVDVSKQGRKHRLSSILIAIIVFSAVGAVLLCLLLGWILLFRHRRHFNQSADAPHVYPSSIARSTGPTGQSAGSRPSFSLSFESSVAAYTGSAKTFSAGEIEKATDNLNPSKVLGEGGFGRVYSGVLEDGTEVAVKVLKRDDQQGGREFLAEVEMLSRLHHRNLVKLIGICVEEHVRCLVYELVPNGSVDSHLHGTDRQTAPLDWATRLKIALGAARGLAYLHEDSSPRVIHRDFKASNILLESDFTPKVSDFGLARTAMDEENKHISTRVMGTFGYVAPEYAMTGHLLVKSDVYSYGVVLLELLTGRKPVDMSQPPGQENLVAWTRPYLTTKEALKSIIDSDLGPDISFDSVAKVAAIASMCVQPEVSHRPFMGEVVQALKLVCNECDDAKDEFDLSSQDENLSNEARDHPLQTKYSVHSYVEDVEKGLSVSDVFTTTDVGSGCKGSESYRRHSSSGPIGGGRSWRFWKRARTTSSREDVVGENGMYRFWSGSH